MAGRLGVMRRCKGVCKVPLALLCVWAGVGALLGGGRVHGLGEVGGARELRMTFGGIQLGGGDAGALAGARGGGPCRLFRIR